MTVNPLYKTVNAESQISDADSTFNYWRSILALRKEHKEILVYGDFKMIDWDNEKVMAYTREARWEVESDPQKVLVLCNWTSAMIDWENKVGKVKEVLLDNYDSAATRFSGVNWVLRPYESCVVLLDYT
jgi:glycosidase